MIKITDNILINEASLQFSFVRASGPGGQNVNKVATAAQLRFDARNSAVIDDAMFSGLLVLPGSA
nr:peptide chain release factor-like protein [Kordiimonas aquimaris]